MGSERTDRVKEENMLQLEPSTELISPQKDSTSVNDSSMIEVELTADTTSESLEVSLVAGGERKSRQQELRQAENREENNLLNLSKLFDRNFLAELTRENTWMDRLRRVIERKDRRRFELMGPYTNDDSRRRLHRSRRNTGGARKTASRSAKRLHHGHPGQKAMLDVSRYLWWRQMPKEIVNVAAECISCTRYGKNAKYIIAKNASKPLPLISQPGRELPLDYAGPFEDTKGKKIYLLVAIDRYSKFPSVKITKTSGCKSSVKFLRTCTDTHGIPKSVRTDQFSGFKGKSLKKFCIEHNIEQKFCPVGDHRGCGLVERTIQTIKRRLGVILLDEIVSSIKLALSTIIRDLSGLNKRRYNVCHLKRISDVSRKLNLKS